MKKAPIIFLVSTFLWSCSNEKTSSEAPYFRVPDYISLQEKKLRSTKSILKRTVTFNNNSEELTINNPDWEKELKPFAECDLNLPAWRNGFQIDTADNAGVRTIRYKAREKRIAIRELELRLAGDSVLHLSVVYLKSNPWYSLGRTLEYTPDKGYTIVIEQDTPLQAPEKIMLEGRFQ